MIKKCVCLGELSTFKLKENFSRRRHDDTVASEWPLSRRKKDDFV